MNGSSYLCMHACIWNVLWCSGTIYFASSKHKTFVVLAHRIVKCILIVDIYNLHGFSIALDHSTSGPTGLQSPSIHQQRKKVSSPTAATRTKSVTHRYGFVWITTWAGPECSCVNTLMFPGLLNADSSSPTPQRCRGTSRSCGSPPFGGVAPSSHSIG